MHQCVTACRIARRLISLSPLCLLIAAAFAAAQPAAAQQAAAVAFEANLTSANAVPSAHTTGIGNVIAVLDGSQLRITGSFAGLASEFASAAISMGAVGEDGEAIHSLEPSVDDGGMSGTFNQVVLLTAAQADALQDGSLYVGVSAGAAEPSEIRGQLFPLATRLLSSSNYAGGGNPFSARILATLNAGEVRIVGHIAGLPADHSATTLHVGTDPASPPVLTLNVDLDADSRGGVLLHQRNIIRLTDDIVRPLLDGQMWMRVYTAGQPGSLLVGQVQPIGPGLTVYEAVLSGFNHAPAVNSSGVGRIVLLLGAPTSGVRIMHAFGSYEGLEGDLADVQLRYGEVGQPGTLVETLPSIPRAKIDGPDPRSGIIRLLDTPVSDYDARAVQDRMMYVNVRSAAATDGELRGQLFPFDARTYSANLAANNTDASGWTTVLLNGTEMRLTGAFEGLTGQYSDAGLRISSGSSQEPSFATLQPVLSSDQHSGVFLPSAENTIMLSDAHYDALRWSRLHVNVESTSHPEGELSGFFAGDLHVSVDEPATLPERFAVSGNYPNPFNPSTKIVFDLPAAAEVHAEVFDLLGRRVLVIPPQPMDAGPERSLQIDAGDLPSGTYVYRVVMQHPGGMQTAAGRMVLTK